MIVKTYVKRKVSEKNMKKNGVLRMYEHTYYRKNELEFHPYQREKAVEYAKTWALSRNPSYGDYEDMGGDCTNFISQCLHAGQIPFDEIGKDSLSKWYWYSDWTRSPSWTGVRPLRTYLLGNNTSETKNFGLYASFCDYEALELGDLVQKTIDGNLTHTMIITHKVYDSEGKISDYLICQHSYDLIDYPLSQKDGVHSYIKIYGYYA